MNPRSIGESILNTNEAQVLSSIQGGSTVKIMAKLFELSTGISNLSHIQQSKDGMILDSQLATTYEKLEKDDFVLTKGDVDSEGHGIPADLVIGKIVSVNKKASNLFQSASVQSLVDFSKLNMVFVMMNN